MASIQNLRSLKTIEKPSMPSVIFRLVALRKWVFHQIFKNFYFKAAVWEGVAPWECVFNVVHL